jgi:hypothetical protein
MRDTLGGGYILTVWILLHNNTEMGEAGNVCPDLSLIIIIMQEYQVMSYAHVYEELKELFPNKHVSLSEMHREPNAPYIRIGEQRVLAYIQERANEERNQLLEVIND